MASTLRSEVLHQQGQELRQAAVRRAQAALAEHPPAQELLLPAVAPPAPEERAAAEEAAGMPAAEGEAAEPSPPFGFAGSEATAEAVASEAPPCGDEGWVVVEPDGVITHTQPHTGGKWLETSPAVVLLAGLSWYFAAASPQDLIVEVAGLLAARLRAADRNGELSH